jgi:hypothetical protein
MITPCRHFAIFRDAAGRFHAFDISPFAIIFAFTIASFDIDSFSLPGFDFISPYFHCLIFRDCRCFDYAIISFSATPPRHCR